MASDSTPNLGPATGTGTTGTTPIADSPGNSTPQTQGQGQGQGQGQAEAQAQAQTQTQGQGQGQTQGRPGGAPTRVYVNEKIVPYLLDGMKTVAREQPSNPLRVLGEMLIQKSNEVEGTENKKSPE